MVRQKADRSIKIVVTGNCQARPIASLLSRHSRIEVVGVFILHLESSDRAEEHQATLESADIVVAQQTADNFNPPHLSSRNLKELGKTIVWPNIFFGGQQPYLRYLTSGLNKRITGPLDVYHDLRLVNAWHQERFGKPLFGEEFSDRRALDLARKSLEELAHRERSCDIEVSEEIQRLWQTERLFFTFNHPTLRLLESVAAKIANVIGIHETGLVLPLVEPLGKIVPPSILDSRSDEDVPIFRGTGGQRFSWASLMAAAFQAYDNQSGLLREELLRQTPAY